MKKRRKLFKNLAVTLPAVWSIPVVETVLLPAHATTSPGAMSRGCDAPARCYATGPAASIIWPGGTGPFLVDFFLGVSCEGEPIARIPFQVAESAEDVTAQQLGCDEGFVPAPDTLMDPAAPDGCVFFYCAAEESQE